MNATHAVIYDGDCAFCRHSVKWLRRLDWRHVLSFVNFRDDGDPIVKAVPTTPERLSEEMHVWPASRNHLYHGFGGLRWLSWRLPLLWLIAPFLYLPLVPWIGQKAYLWVARNRFKLVPCRDGVCTIQQKKS
jgi:predicted DCC family thiol-disulfide oxidoreductase YuxK